MRPITVLSYRALPALCLLPVCAALLRAQSPDSLRTGAVRVEQVFTVTSRDTAFVLSHQFIFPGSEEVFLDSLRLRAGAGYALDRRSGRLQLGDSVRHALQSARTPRATVTVRYRALPFRFRPEYRHHEQARLADSSAGGGIAVAKTQTPFELGEIFGSNLQKSGSIVRGLSVGSNQDLSINSGFRLQMSGNLSPDLQVIAALTDENSPIQPEGTTQTLQEIDNVFIELHGHNVSATLGDFNLNLDSTEFAQFHRKVQGARGFGTLGNPGFTGDLLLAATTARGKFTTNQIGGLDAVQGPYLLAGKYDERTIVVIAGSERVYIDGERMTRGELADYTIDYSTGEITFTPRRLITHASRISVDFEYSDRQFTRNLFAARTGALMLGDRISFHASVIRDADDENAPIDASLSDSDRAVLQRAGDDRSLATRSGVRFVGPGKGQYERRDTVIRISGAESLATQYYIYAPQDTANAVYAVTFSDVGAGNGDYEKVSVTEYRFAGIRAGRYSPVGYLPIPQSTLLTDFDVSARIADDLSIAGEYAVSDFDANRLSTLGDGDNAGPAAKVSLRYAPARIMVGGSNLGSLDAQWNERSISHEFTPIDRINDVEYNRNWNITDTGKADERLHEGHLAYRPGAFLAFNGELGALTRGSAFSSHRYGGGAQLGAVPFLTYNFEDVRSRNSDEDLAGAWFRHRGLLTDTLGRSALALAYAGEKLNNRGGAPDTLKQGTYAFNSVTAGAANRDIDNMLVGLEYTTRWDDSLYAREVRQASFTFGQRYYWQVHDWHTVTSSVDFTLNRRRFEEPFFIGSEDHITTANVRVHVQANPLNRGLETDWFYDAASERSAKLDRVFQPVPIGTGNYRYAGDLNNNHVVDAPDFQPTRFDGDYIAVTVPGDSLVPVVDLKASTRIRLNGSKLFSPASAAGGVGSALSSETYFRVEERSTDPYTQNVYFLRLKTFLSDSTTILGTNLFSQDLYVFENSPDFSLRFRYVERKGLTQLTEDIERTYTREQSVRLRWTLVPGIVNQTDIVGKTDNLAASVPGTRDHGVRSTTVTMDWSYKPLQRLELGFTVAFGDSRNFDTTTAGLNTEAVRMIVSLVERGQIRADFSREEVVPSDPRATYPFEMTGGRALGRSWLWDGALDYRLTNFLQASASYNGRSEAGASVVHTARAEVRAFF